MIAENHIVNCIVIPARPAKPLCMYFTTNQDFVMFLVV